MELENQIIKWISDYLKNNNLKTLVIGVSGGIDSAVTSTLCAMTGFNTKLVIMPIHQNINETKRGINHCNFLKNKYSNIEIIKSDLTNVYAEIAKVREELASLDIPKTVNLKPLIKSLQELEKAVAIIQKENQVQDAMIEEIKLKANNPLAN